MSVERIRFDDVAEPNDDGTVDYEYRGWHLNYRESSYELRGRIYDDEPGLLLIFVLDRPTPYGDPRIARAILALMAAVSATRVEWVGRATDGYVALDLARLGAPRSKARADVPPPPGVDSRRTSLDWLRALVGRTQRHS